MFGMVPFDYNNHNWFDAFDNFEKNFFGNSNVDLPDFRTDIRDADGKYVLEAELPGFNKEDIQLDVKDGILTITAQHTENEDEKNDKGEYIRRKRHHRFVQGWCSGADAAEGTAGSAGVQENYD